MLIVGVGCDSGSVTGFFSNSGGFQGVAPGGDVAGGVLALSPVVLPHQSDVTGMVISPTGDRIYTIDALHGALSILDTTSRRAVDIVQVGEQPKSVALTSDGNLALVACGGGTLAVVDTTTTPATAVHLTVGNQPMGIAIDPSGTRAYVANRGSNTLSVVQLNVSPPTSTQVTVGDGPSYVAFNADSSELLVVLDEPPSLGSSDGSVAFFDVQSESVLEKVPVRRGPTSIVLSPSGKKAYVLNTGELSGGIGIVSVIDTQERQVTQELEVARGPIWMAFSPDGAFGYVACAGTDTGQSSNCFSVGNQVARVEIGEPDDTVLQPFLDVGAAPFGVVTFDGGTKVLVALGCSPQAALYDTANDTLKSIDLPAHAVGLAISPGGREAYVAHASGVSVIDMVTETRVDTISTRGSGPLRLTRVGANALYCVSPGTNLVSVVDVPTESLIATVAVGSYPCWLVAPPGSGKVYVANTGMRTAIGHTIDAVDVFSMLVVDSIDLTGQGPVHLAYSVDGARVFAACHGSLIPTTFNNPGERVEVIATSGSTVGFPISPSFDTAPSFTATSSKATIVSNLYSGASGGELWIVDPGSDQVENTIPCEPGPWTVRFVPSSLVGGGDVKAMVLNHLDDSVSRIIANPSSLSSSFIDTTISVGDAPHDLLIAPNGTTYTANFASGDVSYILDGAFVAGQIPGVGDGPVQLALSDDGAQLFVACYDSDEVCVIDTATKTVETHIQVGRRPFGLVLIGDRLFVANTLDEWVTVVDLTTIAAPVTRDLIVQPSTPSTP